MFCISSHFLLPAPPPAFTSPSALLGEGGRIMRVWSKAPLESAAPSAARVVEGGAALSSCLSASSWLLYWSSGLPLGGVCQATPPLSPSWAQMQLSRQQGGRLASDTHGVCMGAERQWRIPQLFSSRFCHLERGGVSLDSWSLLLMRQAF